MAHPMISGREARITWARGALADIAHHDDATLAAACDILLTESRDHLDHARAGALKPVLKPAAPLTESPGGQAPRPASPVGEGSQQ